MAHQNFLPASRHHGHPGARQTLSGKSSAARMKRLHELHQLTIIAGCSNPQHDPRVALFPVSFANANSRKPIDLTAHKISDARA